MSLDFEKIKEYYSNFEDYKIEHIAKNEAGGLEPEVIPILISEIEKRGLSSDLFKAIELQTKELSEKELNNLKNRIIKLPCPICGQNYKPLKGTLIRKVLSFIVFTSYDKEFIISCKACADKKRKNALILTIILGWWGLPWGIFRTPHAIIHTLIENKKREELSEDILTSLVINNIGEISSISENNDKLIEFVYEFNNQS